MLHRLFSFNIYANQQQILFKGNRTEKEFGVGDQSRI